MVAAINSLDEFHKIIGESKVTVIDCWATWCGPCKQISPVFEKLEAAFPQLAFYKLDVDDQEDVATEVGIKAMPTFLFYKDGAEIGKVVGADPNKLKAAIELHSEA